MDKRLWKLHEAIIYAADKNQDSLQCECDFAEKIKKYPSVMEARFRRMQNIFEKLDLKPGSSIADLGCGTGINSVLAIILGAHKVYSIDMGLERLTSARIIIEFLNLQNSIEVINMDLLKWELPPNSLDGAFSAELLEHISDLSLLYKKLHLWLKTDGRIYARTSGNGKNYLLRRLFIREWNRLDVPYQADREAFIKKMCPQIESQSISKIAQRTRGLLLSELSEVLNEYSKKGTYPKDKSNCVPRNPCTGEYAERLLDPFKTSRQIDAEGFTTYVLKPDFSSLVFPNSLKRNIFKALGKVIAIAHPFSLYFAPWLEFLSIKKLV